MKKILSCVVLCLMAVYLSGCSILLPTQQKEIQQRCTDSTVLLADLTQPASSRVYMLPDKTVCLPMMQDQG